MPLILDTYSAVIKHLRNEWGETSDIEQENKSTKPTAPYIRATIIPAGNNKVEVGVGGLSKYEAILAIDIFTTLGTGIGVSTELASTLLGIFPAGERVVSDDNKAIRFTAPQTLPGLDDGHGYYQATIHCPFYFYH